MSPAGPVHANATWRPSGEKLGERWLPEELVSGSTVWRSGVASLLLEAVRNPSHEIATLSATSVPISR
jgi:hypothetical protein